eukprot:m.11663 g.11663  ORF g.11663 m.11663 type:complete len:258 (-) comp5755_c0_seq1:29-802(-)
MIGNNAAAFAVARSIVCWMGALRFASAHLRVRGFKQQLHAWGANLNVVVVAHNTSETTTDVQKFATVIQHHPIATYSALASPNTSVLSTASITPDTWGARMFVCALGKKHAGLVELVFILSSQSLLVENCAKIVTTLNPSTAAKRCATVHEQATSDPTQQACFFFSPFFSSLFCVLFWLSFGCLLKPWCRASRHAMSLCKRRNSPSYFPSSPFDHQVRTIQSQLFIACVGVRRCQMSFVCHVSLSSQLTASRITSCF